MSDCFVARQSAPFACEQGLGTGSKRFRGRPGAKILPGPNPQLGVTSRAWAEVANGCDYAMEPELSVLVVLQGHCSAVPGTSSFLENAPHTAAISQGTPVTLNGLPVLYYLDVVGYEPDPTDQ